MWFIISEFVVRPGFTQRDHMLQNLSEKKKQ